MHNNSNIKYLSRVFWSLLLTLKLNNIEVCCWHKNIPSKDTLGRMTVPWIWVAMHSSYMLWGWESDLVRSAVLRLLPPPVSWLRYWSRFRTFAASTRHIHDRCRWFNTLNGWRLVRVGVSASMNLCRVINPSLSSNIKFKVKQRKSILLYFLILKVFLCSYSMMK